MIERIAAYWDERSTTWLKEKQEAWTQPETEHWLEFFKDLRTKVKGNKVLEIGTATGYFANIMTLAGFQVTAVDLAPQMIQKAKAVTKELNLEVDYKIMDAQNLDFNENSFDLVFTRLMTIPNVQQCYQEIHRVLQPEGLLVNFDSDFGQVVFSTEGHEKCADGAITEVNAIKSELEISKHTRPDRDIEILESIGFKDIIADKEAQNRILGLPLGSGGQFLLQAKK